MKTKNKGITLIALVITIIILLILAVVTIGQLTGNGLFDKVKLAKQKAEEAQAKENAMLKAYEDLIDGNLQENTEDTEAGTLVIMPSEWYTEMPDEVKTSDGSIASKGQKVASVYAVSDGEANTIPVPKGFYYVGGTKSTGVVISDNEKDRNKYAGQKEVDSGAVYDTSTGKVKEESQLTNEEKQKAIFGNQFVWIPCKVDEYQKVNFGLNEAGWDSSTYSVEKIQIEKYGGFYIGRYEAGTSQIKLEGDYTFEEPKETANWSNANYTYDKITEGTITSKAGEIPFFHVSYTTAVKLAEKMYNTSSVRSGLITGTMWDTVMKFIATDKETYLDLKNTPWGNYNTATSEMTYEQGRGKYLVVSSSNGVESGKFTVSNTTHNYGIRTTGSSDGARKSNMYDLAGNLWEWTQEAAWSSSSQNIFMLRGGSFYYSCTTTSGRPVCYRGYSIESSTSTHYGFRTALYIK